MPTLTPSNSVFISYRRDASRYLTLAIFQDLKAHGFDVFYDIESIDAGQFDTIILNQIPAHPYFLLVLTPTTLERCKNEGDWLLREIEEALHQERVCIWMYSHDFDLADIDKHLPEKVSKQLQRFQNIDIPKNYFDAAMQRLRDRYLKPIAITVTPTPKADILAVERKQELASAEPLVTEKQLTAEEYFARGLSRPNEDLDGKIADYDEAIRLNPKNANAYTNRGATHKAKGELDLAIADYDEAIQLNPKNANAYTNRGNARKAKNDLDGAIADFEESIRLNPSFAEAYYNRGVAHYDRSEFDAAIADFEESIRLNPSLAYPYYGLAFVESNKSNYSQAILDLERFLELAPNDDFSPIARTTIERWRKLLE
jgi:tetratricopeptide (TPR) repeat protein